MPESGPRKPLTILDAMILIAGVAFGLWLFQDKLKFPELFTDGGLVAAGGRNGSGCGCSSAGRPSVATFCS
jgi:hypothetical protein